MRFPARFAPGLMYDSVVALNKGREAFTGTMRRLLKKALGWRLPSPAKVVAIYVLAGVLWVVISDDLFLKLVTSLPAFVRLDVLKKMLFLGVTAGVLYFVIDRYSAETRRELQRSAATAEAILESAVSGIVVVDQEGHIVGANGQAERLFGYSRYELLGQSVEVLLPERLREAHVAHRSNYLKAVCTPATLRRPGLVGRRKDGSEFPVEIGLGCVESESGRLGMAFVTDITERVQLERETRRAESLATLGAMAAGIAHELNNPIGIISSRIELMISDSEGKQLPAEMAEDLQVLHRNALRVSKIAQGLLTLARQRPRQPKRVNVNSVVEDTLLLAGNQMSKDGIQVSISLDRTIPPILGDSTSLEEVLLNLLMNAREAMESGGTIRIETGVAPDRPDWVRVAVADSGCGIPADAMGKLFDPFFTTKASGTGLGLWVSKRIVRDHGGSIEVESEPGRGTTFVIAIPSATVTENPEGATEPAGGSTHAPSGER